MSKEVTKMFVENYGFVCNNCGEIIVDGDKHRNEEDLCDQCKIADLEAKLADMERCAENNKKIAELVSAEHNAKIENLENQLADSEEHIDALELQLREQYQLVDEKDKQLRAKIGNMKSNEFIKMCISCGFLVDAKVVDNQDKISFAIEQLEKVKADINTYNKEHCFLSTEIDTCNKSVEIIDNQIEQLKEMK